MKIILCSRLQIQFKLFKDMLCFANETVIQPEEQTEQNEPQLHHAA